MPHPDPAARSRFSKALAAYAVLGLLSYTTLDGNVRWFLLILLGGLAIKSWVDLRRRELD
jgi:hypothetical protein